jgi:UDP-N-acetylglucosamine--N-acetylmuramyl-(pentapeptide) pyrophosphoryl-undecaprenol N-acetylglucosamine transferase
MNKKIVFTGGGTAGHVLPSFPLIEKFLADGFEVHYIGSKDGIEKELLAKNFPDVKYHGITCDKLRRYITYKHFFMPFKLSYGFSEALFLLHKLKPAVVFSKGGFVSVPVAILAWILRIPIIVHESDYSVGLANKLVFPFAKLIAVSFSKELYSSKYHRNMIHVGPLIRKSFLSTKCPENINIYFPDKEKKTIMIMGGSLGAKSINSFVYNNLPELTEKFNVIHICGRGNKKYGLENSSYFAFEYLNEGISYLMSVSDLIVSRAGVNSIWEILLMKKPNILIPLSIKQSRGDQIENAHYFEKLSVSKVINDENLNAESLIHQIEEIFNNYQVYLKSIEQLNLQLGQEVLYEEILKLLR